MGKKATTTLTFSITVPQPELTKIPTVRSMIIDAVAGMLKVPMSDIKCHLTNKETSYK